MTTVADCTRAGARAAEPAGVSPVRIALLGVGQVGGALAQLVRDPELAGRFAVSRGLVRDLLRKRPHADHVRLTADPASAFDGLPDIVVEALGGLEPARSLVASALERGVPVVTANKSLLAAHGEELLDIAARTGVPLRYEAAVLAGVPFLGTFERRKLARDITAVCGIVNGTTNFVLTRMAELRSGFGAALETAQRLGYAEPDPASDVDGVDAAEKLCVLLRHFGDWSVRPADVETVPITTIDERDLDAAAELGGVIKPLVYGDWSDGPPLVFCGPAYVPDTHPLARVAGVQNSVVLHHRTSGQLAFTGPGAGPVVTAATLLDDAAEIAGVTGANGANRATPSAPRLWKRVRPATPDTSWLVRIAGSRLPDDGAIAERLSACGVPVRRSVERRSDGRREHWVLTHVCTAARVEAALEALRAAGVDRAASIRALETSEP